MDEPIILGYAETAQRSDRLREGTLEVRSRRGLRKVEGLLIEALPRRAPTRLLTGNDAAAAVALAARAVYGDEPAISWWHLDAYVTGLAQGNLTRRAEALDTDLRVEVLCQPDLPGAVVPGEPAPAADAEPFDLIVLPFPKRQEAILGRELIEEAHTLLPPGGRLLAATDDPKATWLKKVLREIFGNATPALKKRKVGQVLMAKRTKERAEVRDHRHPIQVTLRGRTFKLTSRPGVFGHAGLDAGTRALAETFEVGPDDSVLDLGCGYGALSLVAAAATSGRVVGVDSNARAVALTAGNAARNELPNVSALLRRNLEDLGDEPFDVALANPPYFSDFRIARAFVGAAADRLRPGGRLWLVAKAAERHAELLDERFEEVDVALSERGHGIVTGVLPR